MEGNKGVYFLLSFVPCCPHSRWAQAPVALTSHMGAAWLVDLPVGHNDRNVPFEWAEPVPFLHTESWAPLCSARPSLLPVYPPS